MTKLFKFFFFLTILSIPFYILRFNIGPVPTTVLEVLIYLSFLFALFSGKISKVSQTAAVIASGLLVIAALLGVYLDPDKMAALGLWKAYFFDGLLLFIIALSLDEKEKSEAIDTLIACGFIAAILAIVLYVLHGGTVDGRMLDLDRISPNYLAMFLTPVVWLIFGQIAKNKKGTWLYLPSLVAVMIAILATGSRGALVGALGGALVFALKRIGDLKGSRITFAKIFVVFVVLGLISSAWFFRPTLGTHDRTGSSSNIRFYIWQTSLEIIKNKPLGVGLSNYQKYFTELTKDRTNYLAYIAPQALTAHNLYLHLYLATTPFALILFVLLICVSKFWRVEAGLVAAIASVLIYGLVDTPFFRNDLSAFFWIVLGLATIRIKNKESRIKNENQKLDRYHS